MVFYGCTVSPWGEEMSRYQHDSDKLVPQAVEILLPVVRTTAFRRWRIPGTEPAGGIDLEWSVHEGSAFATFWLGETMLVNCAFLTGSNGDADTASIIDNIIEMYTEKLGPDMAQFASKAVKDLTGKAHKRYQLQNHPERPLMVALVMPPLGDIQAISAMPWVGDIETCLCGAYFPWAQSTQTNVATQ